MQYAESMLLGGQLISAEEVDKETYDELICVCPHSKKKVELVSYPSSTLPGYEKLPFIFTWVHSEKIPQTELDECNEKNKYSQAQVHKKNMKARKRRYNFYKKYLWEILSRLPISNGNDLNELHESVWKSDSMKWYAESFKYSCRDKDIQDYILRNVKKTYDTTVAESSLIKKDKKLEKIVDLIVEQKHGFFHKEIAGEALLFCLKYWSESEIEKLICYGFSELLLNHIEEHANSMIELALKLLAPDRRFKLIEKTNSNWYLGMVDAMATIVLYPTALESYLDGMEIIDDIFFSQLYLIFLCIPWIDELKKLNQQSQTENIC